MEPVGNTGRILTEDDPNRFQTVIGQVDAERVRIGLIVGIKRESGSQCRDRGEESEH